MEETSEEHPNFSIGIDLLGPDPTSSKNKAEFKTKLSSCAFCKFVEDQLQQILGERLHCERNRHQLVINKI